MKTEISASDASESETRATEIQSSGTSGINLSEQLPDRLIPLAQALNRKDSESNTDSCRLFHGRGHCYPGLHYLTVDFFHPVVLATYFDLPDPADEPVLQVLLLNFARANQLSAVVIQRRYLPGAPSEVIDGQVPDSVYAQRTDCCNDSQRFHIQPGQHQNVGYFLDMEPGRLWLEQHAKGKRVLNLFAYTCAFSVVAHKAGAQGIVNVDMSRGALNQGRKNHHLNNLQPDNVQFLQENILKSWGRIRRKGPFDTLIIDPPSYQPGSFVARKDYVKVIKRLPQLLKPQGNILLCLNAPQLGVDFLAEMIGEHCPDCHYIERLPAHTDFPDQNPDQQLKLLHYRYLPPE